MHICEVTYSLQLHINDKRLVHGRVKKNVFKLVTISTKNIFGKTTESNA